MAKLIAFVPDAGMAQRNAWIEELAVLEREGTQVLAQHAPARDDAALLEYMLPREAGRRPDVLVLQNGRVVVLEFKQSGELRRADVDQVHAYARDLQHYHSACEGLEVVPMLVLCAGRIPLRAVDDVRIVPATRLGSTLLELARDARGVRPTLAQILEGEYAPLPTLVAAARLLFQNLELPYVRRAASAGVHDAVEHVLALARDTRTRQTKTLVLVTGVPGAGKTLVGLQVAHSAALEEGFRFGARRPRGAPATFLSGNGPLVQVLQHALKSTAFVQDMHRYIREYGLERPTLVPPEHVVVFDEAQRAWDRAKLSEFYAKKLPHADLGDPRSEPDLLIEISDRREGGTLVLALVGEGQEIHAGEEAGLGQWAEAIARSGHPWRIVGPPRLATTFAGHAYEADDVLDLDTSLRALGAGDVHRWVAELLDGQPAEVPRARAARLRREGFPIYVTRDLEAAKRYVRDRFVHDPSRRFGLLASSKAKNLSRYGIEADFQSTKRIHVGRWFNDEPESRHSGCRFESVLTEFQCQGLELDLPVVAWGDDFTWSDQGFTLRARGVQRLVRDPRALRTNAYRVLLSRGREGLVIFVPDEGDPAMNRTFERLVSCGALAVKAASEADGAATA